MDKRPVYCRMEEATVEKLDELAEYGVFGSTRSEVIRNIVISNLPEYIKILRENHEEDLEKDE